MDRRKALKLVTGALAVGGLGALTLSTAFKPERTPSVSKKLVSEGTASDWAYTPLDPEAVSALAYDNFSVGSCMYAVTSSIITLLKEQVGEPYPSFPIHMMKYGHGGIGDQGTVCGTLNGAGAIIGLLITDKKNRDALMSELFHWYQNTAFPSFVPTKAVFDYTPPTSVSGSSLCHVSNTKWAKKAGYRVDSDQRKERCRRLAADVAAHTVTTLNLYFDDAFVTNGHDSDESKECMECHSGHGGLGNASGQMNCTSCHEKSLAHKIFGDIHYKLLKKR